MSRCAWVLLGLLLTGCARDQRIVGTWDWGTDEIRFDSSGEYESYQKANPTVLHMGGSWSMSGQVLKLQPTVIDPPEADPIYFHLSPDAKSLIGSPQDGAMTNHRP